MAKGKKKTNKDEYGSKKLTPKQKLFCREYIIDFNATRSAIAAGYSKKTAKNIGSENLTKLYVSEFIQECMDKRAEKLEITSERVLAELARLAYGNMDDYVKFNKDGTATIDLSEMTREKASVIHEITIDRRVGGNDDGAIEKVKLKLYDKRASLDMLMRHLNEYRDHNEASAGDTHIHLTNKEAKEMSTPELSRLIAEKFFV